MAKKPHPNIKPGDWIDVAQRECVVSKLYRSDSSSGVCEVVFNPNKPTNCDVDWDGEKWFFPERGDYGGYADKYPRLSEFVAILKKGRGVE